MRTTGFAGSRKGERREEETGAAVSPRLFSRVRNLFNRSRRSGQTPGRVECLPRLSRPAAVSFTETFQGNPLRAVPLDEDDSSTRRTPAACIEREESRNSAAGIEPEASRASRV